MNRTSITRAEISLMLPWDLEDWLTEEGDKVVRKAADAKTQSTLADRERLLYEVWLFDTEQRNGGVSQYFCNRGLSRWDLMSGLAKLAIPSFPPFASRVNEVVGRSPDPYLAVLNSDVDLDAWYQEHQLRIITELRAR